MVTFLGVLIVIFVFLIVILISVWSTPYNGFVTMRMRQIVPFFQYSTQQFYTTLAERIKACQMSDVRFALTSYADFKILSKRQEYLRIQRNRITFDICAAPYGTTFFVSCWIGDTTNSAWYAFSRLPIIGKILEARIKNKSFYELDLDAVFEDIVRQCLSGLITEITSPNATRTPELGATLTQQVIAAP